jgi:hypothetical protein
MLRVLTWQRKKEGDCMRAERPDTSGPWEMGGRRLRATRELNFGPLDCTLSDKSSSFRGASACLAVFVHRACRRRAKSCPLRAAARKVKEGFRPKMGSEPARKFPQAAILRQPEGWANFYQIILRVSLGSVNTKGSFAAAYIPLRHFRMEEGISFALFHANLL